MTTWVLAHRHLVCGTEIAIGVALLLGLVYDFAHSSGYRDGYRRGRGW